MKIKIVAVIVDTRRTTLYKANGETIVIKQGDPRLRPILDEAMPQIIKQGYAEIEFAPIDTGFQQFEKKSGVVRFFKVAREKLAGLFAEPIKGAVVGRVPVEDIAQKIQQTDAVVLEILAHAQPVSHADFDTSNVAQQGNIVEDRGHTDSQVNETKTSHTIVAQVNGKLIPNMERIESHFVRASNLGNTVGVENFLKRLAAVIDQRSHSVEDLLKFMERSDMPVADDGSIVIYKVLKRRDGHYVDCHSQKVPQKVGSYVCMDIDLVDRNRNNECSNGLHVARRGYVGGFSGDVCVIAKLAPEDVITVPTYDANKMRVMGYHILAELPQELYDQLKKNKPITDLDAGKILLGNVLAGNHVRRREEVRITQQMGGGVVITPIAKPVVLAPPAPAPVAKAKKKTKKRAAPAEALSNPVKEKTTGAKPIDPKAVVKAVASLSRKDQAQKLFKAFQKNPSAKNRAKLVAFKKSVKLGWGALGIDPAGLE